MLDARLVGRRSVLVQISNPEVDVTLEGVRALQINLVALSDECLVIYANERTAA